MRGKCAEHAWALGQYGKLKAQLPGKGPLPSINTSSWEVFYTHTWRKNKVPPTPPP